VASGRNIGRMHSAVEYEHNKNPCQDVWRYATERASAIVISPSEIGARAASMLRHRRRG